MSPSAATRMVRPQPLFALAAACAAILLLLIGLEIRAAADDRRAARAAPVATALPVQAASLSPGPVQDWTRIVLARPLFSPSRRPAAVAISGPERPRLAGIIIAPGGGRAIFAGDGNARGTVAGVGQQAGAWRVLGIAPSGVRVMGPDGPRTLRPSRDPVGSAQDTGAAADLPAHPSILDLLRSHVAAMPNGGGDGAPFVAPVLPPILRALHEPGPPPGGADSDQPGGPGAQRAPE